MKWLRPALPHQLRGKLIPLPQSSKHTSIIRLLSYKENNFLKKKKKSKGSGKIPLRCCVCCVSCHFITGCVLSMIKLIETRRTLSPGSALHLSCYMTLSPHPLTLVLLFRNNWISSCTIELVSAQQQ